ncbi:thiol-activated cytolysin family protein [Solimonas sp. K1W22B-7]|uniref:thiol-activated cytolysin family protein n=1 Tax=Solimonas sp. K1W22B-7 TaxID=2303331 RepID=UPI0013C4283A|nr:thiol-activated cytolysin family protein [Solimonas sp. K1W22B-7]
MPEAINVKAVRINPALLRATARLRPQVKFKFQVPKRAELFAAPVKLAHGGTVNVTALRNPTASSRTSRKSSGTGNQGAWACSTASYSMEIISREAAVLNPNFANMYPGAVYDYKEIANGSYKPLPYTRKPISINVDGMTFAKAAMTVPHPSQSTIRQAIATMKGSQKAQGGSRTFGSSFEVLSEEDLFIRTGGSGYFLGFGGSHQVDYKSNRKSYKYFIDVAQTYYTIGVDDTVNEPSDFFVTKAEQPSSKDALDEAKIDPNWVYVEDVAYGRLLQVMFESDEDLETVGIDVKAHANLLVAGGEGSLSSDQRSMLSRTTITLAAIGGKAEYAGKLVNSTFADLRRRVDDYFGGANDEVPIAYSLRTLDGSLVGTKMMTEFTSRQCSPLATKYKVTWKNVRCLRSDDQDSNSNPEDTKLLVRIRAWDGKGKDIVDQAKINLPMLQMQEVMKAAGKELWTFGKGNEDHPVELATGEVRDFSTNYLVFPITPGDKNAKIGIRADVLEYDGFGDVDDNFADEAKSYTVADVGSGKDVKLLCTHDDSRIEFNFRIEPIYE